MLAILSMSEIVAADGGADVSQRIPQPGTELAVVLPILQTLPVRLERGCMRGHVVANLRKPLILTHAIGELENW